MLEEIHATPEDRRTTLAIVALGLVGFGLFSVADAMLSQWNAVSTFGLALGATGTAMLNWLRAHRSHTPEAHA